MKINWWAIARLQVVVFVTNYLLLSVGYPAWVALVNAALMGIVYPEEFLIPDNKEASNDSQD